MRKATIFWVDIIGKRSLQRLGVTSLIEVVFGNLRHPKATQGGVALIS